MGGGFGGKESQSNLFACVAALVAKKTGRAAKIRPDRDDDMVITGKRHDFEVRLPRSATTRTAGSTPSTCSSPPAAAGPPTCRGRSPTAPCSTPTIATTTRRCT